MCWMEFDVHDGILVPRASVGPGGLEYGREYHPYDLLGEGELFHFHENPNPDCPVGRNIHAVLDDKLMHIQEAMENEMKKYTIADVAREIEK